MQKPIKICESSLRWILGLRMRADQHKYKHELLSQYPEVFTDQHSGGSMMWSIIQAKKIDQIGLEQWLRTQDAQGYGNAFKRYMDGDNTVFEPKTKKGYGVSPSGVPIYPIMK